MERRTAAPLDTRIEVATPEGVALALSPAGPVPRAAAWCIDQLLRIGGYLLIAAVLGLLNSAGTGILLLVVFVGEWFYPVLFEVLNGGVTPGKSALGLAVVERDGRPVGWTASTVRNFLRIADFLPVAYGIGLLSMLSSRRFQRLGDLAAGTMVVHRGRPPDERKPNATLAAIHAAMEPLDQGFALAQRHSAVICRAWLLVVLPAMLLLVLLEQLAPEGLRYSGWLLWWAKPFYDAVVLLALGRAVIGERPAVRELLGDLGRGSTALAGALTWRRLSLSRSFLLPSHLLEGLRGDAGRERLAQLRNSGLAGARLATISCALLNLVLFASLVVLPYWLAPDFASRNFGGLFDPVTSPLNMAFWQAVNILAMSCIEPFYVAAGFALYLHRRAVMEGHEAASAPCGDGERPTAYNTAGQKEPVP